MIVLHAVWTRERLHLWAEDAGLAAPSLAVLEGVVATQAGDSVGSTSEPAGTSSSTPVAATAHPFAVDAARLRGMLVSAGLLAGDDLAPETAPLRLSLPATTAERGIVPLPSDRLA
ncbi:MAG: hypothetical protein ACK5C3_14570, partial [bacterium]